MTLFRQFLVNTTQSCICVCGYHYFVHKMNYYDNKEKKYTERYSRTYSIGTILAGLSAATYNNLPILYRMPLFFGTGLAIGVAHCLMEDFSKRKNNIILDNKEKEKDN